MKSAYLLTASLLAATLVSAPAYALTDAGLSCYSFDTAISMGAAACTGAYVGDEIALQPQVLAQIKQDFSGIVGNIDWVFAGKTDAGSSSGPFSSVPVSSSGTLTLDTPATGYFAVGLQAGNQFSVYLFNGGVNGISSLQFTTTGTAFENDVPQALSHASLYFPGRIPPVPEAETYLLMLAGLGLIGYVARRKAR